MSCIAFISPNNRAVPTSLLLAASVLMQELVDVVHTEYFQPALEDFVSTENQHQHLKQEVSKLSIKWNSKGHYCRYEGLVPTLLTVQGILKKTSGLVCSLFPVSRPPRLLNRSSDFSHSFQWLVEKKCIGLLQHKPPRSAVPFLVSSLKHNAYLCRRSPQAIDLSSINLNTLNRGGTN